MCRCTHETSDLKLVMLFDRRNQTYRVCSHNLPMMPYRKWPSYVATVFRHSRWTNTRGICRSIRTNVRPVVQMSRTQSGHCLPLSAKWEGPDSAADPTLNNHKWGCDLGPLLSPRTA